MCILVMIIIFVTYDSTTEYAMHIEINDIPSINHNATIPNTLELALQTDWLFICGE